MESNKINILLNDGSIFQISPKAAELSELIKRKIKESPNDKEIKIEGIEKATMDSIIEYLNYYSNIDPPNIESPLVKPDLQSTLAKENEDNFSFNFIQNFNMDFLANLCLAAELLEINPLLDLCCAKIAYMCKDKDETAILKNFGIKSVFTAEEKEEIRNENEWVNEEQ